MLSKILSALVGLILLLFAPNWIAARSLYWQDMDVQAHLDRDGRLHVHESQTIVFNGDWNGGERRFSIRPGQTLNFEHLLRVDPMNKTTKELTEGSLAEVDNFGWQGTNTLRWRSRLATDPPFQNTPITYILEYTLSRIVAVRNDGTYLLDHDFLFPDRSDRIEKAHLRLELDPAWQSIEGSLIERNLTGLAPGQSMVITLALTHLSGAPQEIVQSIDKQALNRLQTAPNPAPSWLGWSMSSFLCLLLLVFFLRFFRHEQRLGRLRPLPLPAGIDRNWLNEHVFQLPPEVVGATWDNKTNFNEVAAVIARLVQEKKISSRVEEFILPFFNIRITSFATLHMQLNQPRSKFSGYERKLIDGFFIDGDTTDTKRIRKYYQDKKRTFNPASELSDPLNKQVDILTHDKTEPLAYAWLPTVALATIGLFILLANSFLHQTEVETTIASLVLLSLCWICGGCIAYTYRSLSTGRLVRILILTLFSLLICGGFFLLADLQISTLGLSGSFFVAVAAILNIPSLAMTRDNIKGVELRLQLTAAREFFKAELQKDRPNLEDGWFPYLMAFGLGTNVDRWFKQFGNSSMLNSSSGSSGGGSAGFTGGGGQFGGGGASGAWMAAAGAIAAGASSSSGGGGGGGSSGGGGGGGW